MNTADRTQLGKKSKRRIAIAAACLFVVSAVLLQFPLLNALGYEFSCAIAFFIPWFCGIPLLGIFKEKTGLINAGNRTELKRAATESVTAAAILLLIPFVCATLNAIVVQNCSYADGVIFYLLLPFITALWTIALAFFCVATFRRPVAGFIFINVLLLLYPLYIGYVSPQIYSYHPVYGYFPGLSYDEVLRVTPTLLLFRGVTILASLLMALVGIAAVRARWRRRSEIYYPTRWRDYARPDRLEGAIVLLAVALGAAFLARDRLGFETSDASIRRELSTMVRTEHFRISFTPGSFTEEEARWVAAMHEFRLKQVEAALQTDFRGIIASFIYPTDDVKRDLIGTATTNIAKPWLKEIHLGRDSWERTLRHELVHVVAGEFGMPVIKANLQTGIVEGLAMAVDDDFGNRTLHEYSAAMMRFGIVAKPEELIGSLGFVTHASSVSYVLAGSFCRFLIDRYGIFRFRDYYGGRGSVRVYGKPMENLASEWRRYLERIEVPASWRDHMYYYFRRPSIFAKGCARAIAAMNELAWRDLDEHRPEEASRRFSAALAASWNSESFAGLVRAESEANRTDSVIRLVDTRLKDTAAALETTPLLLTYGDALWRAGDVGRAAEAYRKILSYDLSMRTDEAASLRIGVIGDTVLQRSLSRYFGRSLTDSSALAMLADARRHSSSPLLDYLEALVRFRRQEYRTVVNLLSDPREAFGAQSLGAGRELLVAEAWFKLRIFSSARIHFWQSLNFISNAASIDRVNDAIDRCEWFDVNAATYFPRPSG